MGVAPWRVWRWREVVATGECDVVGSAWEWHRGGRWGGGAVVGTVVVWWYVALYLLARR